MPLDTRVVGTAVGPRTFTVAARHCMAYAAGTEDPNPAYMDDTRPEGVIAPPLMGVRLDWPLQTGMRAGMEGMTPNESRRGVHATHDMLFHRSIRPGDVLTTSGRVVLVEARSPGAYMLTRFDTVDAAGVPVVTTFYGSIFRGVEVAGERAEIADAGPPLLPEKPAGAHWSEMRWVAPVHVSPLLPHIYTETADIWNPIHTELSVARAAGLPDIILHGTATLALAARELVNREADGDPTRLARIGCRFGATVLPGTTIEVYTTHERETDEGRGIWFGVANAGGMPAIRDGFAVFRGSRQ